MRVLQRVIRKRLVLMNPGATVPKPFALSSPLRWCPPRPAPPKTLLRLLAPPPHLCILSGPGPFLRNLTPNQLLLHEWQFALAPDITKSLTGPQVTVPPPVLQADGLINEEYFKVVAAKAGPYITNKPPTFPQDHAGCIPQHSYSTYFVLCSQTPSIETPSAALLSQTPISSPVRHQRSHWPLLCP